MLAIYRPREERSHGRGGTHKPWPLSVVGDEPLIGRNQPIKTLVYLSVTSEHWPVEKQRSGARVFPINALLRLATAKLSM